jgi:hypothetical protein
VTYPDSTPVGNATLVVANMLMCNKHSKLLAWTLRVYRRRASSSSISMTAALIRLRQIETLTNYRVMIAQRSLES